ncbi:RIP metalloprotease RseP [Planktothrix sp. FACHB-1355]|uniref:Zinc metalloprotease n=1 Tax=Aerosakkonema funiforme FACHB-1375 TaxID=2949571 RepID=A0A926ZGQ4_9CYAN|nr:MULTISPECIES: RIP metalloprotease RseP [Oscillatoriales]MBD2182240.1 RIP metalloprotease RseP [Aerosakkonema funiforme FACHB-1375]MBD3561423.1 RIP metalloprotease RseP [Planktothrix sp. FACHB-1355]
MSVLATIAVLAVLILVHELGHFMAARFQGIHANRFSLGFGPILWKYQGPETEYAIRAFPLGGFVGFPDDEPDSKYPPDDPNLLSNRPVLDRAIVISAGVIANLIFAYLVLVAQFGVIGMPEASQPGVLVPQLVAEVTQVTGEAESAGIKPGDVIWVNGKRFGFSINENNSQAELIATTSGEPIQLKVNRNNEQVDFSLTPKLGADGKGHLGIQLAPSVAAVAGIQPGDVILAANGKQFGRSLKEEAVLKQLIRSSAGQPIQFTIQRGSSKLSLTATPIQGTDGEARIGIALAPNGPKDKPVVYRRPHDIFEVFSLAAEEFQHIATLTVQGFGQLIGNFQETASQVAGPVKIVEIGANIAKSDITQLFRFAALISINLAVINILPLPALDGGQLAFLFIEAVRGKPLPSKIQDGVMQTGLMLLLGLGIFLIVRDTANLEGVQNLFR